MIYNFVDKLSLILGDLLEFVRQVVVVNNKLQKELYTGCSCWAPVIRLSACLSCREIDLRVTSRMPSF